MRILFVCHRFPYPPSRGGKIRAFNIIRHLSESGHEVHVASLARSKTEIAEGARLAAHCKQFLVEPIGNATALWQMVARLPSSEPSSFGFFFSRALQRRVRALLDTTSFDLVFAHCSSVAHYVEHVQGIPKMLDFGDMDSQKWLMYGDVRAAPVAWGFKLEGIKLQREERRLADRFDLCSATTRAELETLRSYGSSTESGWFPNGVDFEYFRPSSEDYDGEQICFIGRMDYYPNQQGVVWFCNEVLPLLHRARPSVKFAIVGAAPPPAITRLGSLPGVTVTGQVPDVRPYVRRSAVTVAPLSIARGTQNKILEAVALGVPVVASTAACNGVDLSPGEHVLAADSPADVASRVLEVLESKQYRNALAERALARVKQKHSWQASMHELDGLIARVTGSRASKLARRAGRSP